MSLTTRVASERLPTLCVAVLMMALATGCAGVPGRPGWGAEAHWPSLAELGQAASAAARDPATWAPAGAALALSFGDLDEDASEWLADDGAVFGSDAERASDRLRDVTTAAWLVTALLAPSDSAADKARGLAVGAAATALQGGLTDVIKDAASRERPDDSNDRAFPSRHASDAAARSTLALRNLDHIALPRWADVTLRTGLHAAAVGSAWARVDAERHHVTDVLAGYALGRFVASFMHDAFLEGRVPEGLELSFRPRSDGAALSVRIPL